MSDKLTYYVETLKRLVAKPNHSIEPHEVSKNLVGVVEEIALELAALKTLITQSRTSVQRPETVSVKQNYSSKE